MAKNFYIFRHGETDYNLQRIWQGQKCDTELNQNGIEQACDLSVRGLDGKRKLTEAILIPFEEREIKKYILFLQQVI